MLTKLLCWLGIHAFVWVDTYYIEGHHIERVCFERVCFECGRWENGRHYYRRHYYKTRCPGPICDHVDIVYNTPTNA